MNAPHAARITDDGGTRKNTSLRRHDSGSSSSSSSGYLATSGPEGARTRRNDRTPQTKRNYCHGTADPRSVVAGDDPLADPHPHPLQYRRQRHHHRTRSGYRRRVWYLPCRPVIIVHESLPATERCRPRGCYRVRSKNIVQRARRNGRVAMPEKINTSRISNY
ncbi:unnamed protein product [Aphis gossypii]|uniref:Uncharacterized protein n=1 Tax=Aphis gossypii TaxID=80765 RepID=A0A9P0IIC3_APHGO|nr:unnamed protein product [Aphis gossypii]